MKRRLKQLARSTTAMIGIFIVLVALVTVYGYIEHGGNVFLGVGVVVVASVLAFLLVLTELNGQ